MKKINLIEWLWKTDSHEKQKTQRFARYAAMLLMLLTLGVGQMWANGGIGYKGVKFTKNGSATGWYNIHNVSWDYSNASYECRSGQTGVTDFNNASLGTVTTLKLKAFVVIGWTDNSDYVAGQLKYRLYKQGASAPSYSTYNVGNYGSSSNSSSAANVLVSSDNNRVVGNASLTTDIVTSSTPAGNYYLQLQGLGRMQWSNGSSHGDFNANNGSEVKATLLVPGFTTTSTSNAYGSVNVGSNSSTTISFTQHYGTALTTSNCSLTNSTDFEVTAISETGVTVKFKPQASGDKSCTLTITDANSKTCTITLTGTGTTPPGLTVVAGTGISAVTGSDNDISAGDNIAITATVATGYTWDRWTLSGSGTLSTFTATTKNQTVTVGTAASMTLTASATENMSSLSTSCSYDAGNPSYAAPTVSGSATNVGYATTRTITATAAGTGYTFAGWTLTNCTRTDGGSPTATSITIRSNGDGAAATVVANYNEDLSSPYTLKGGTNVTGDNWATAHNFTKKTGHSTENVAYCTFNVASTNSGIDGEASAWSFKLIKDGSTWYGLSADGDSWWYQRNSGQQTLSTSGQNIQLCADVAGPYEIKVDYTTPASPKVTVTFPTSYTLTYSIGSVAGTSGSISTSPTTASGSKVLSGTNVTLTGPAAKTGYTWKGWYTNAAGTEGKIADVSRAITVTMNANKTLYACYTENTYNVSASATPAGYGKVTPTSSTSMGQINGGNITASPNAGYSFSGWSIASGSGYFGASGTATTSNTANTKFRPTANATLTGTFAEVLRTVTVAVNNSYLGSVSTTSLSSVGPVTKSAEVTATAETGASFSSWTLPSGVTAAAGYTTSSNPIKVNATAASKTITANFTETTYTVSMSTEDGDKGTVADASKSVGQITAVQITATPKSGYMFSKWVKTAGAGTVTYYTGPGNGQVTDASGEEKETTYICVTGNVTLQATWEPDRSSGYVVHYGNSGKNADGGDDASQTRPWKDGKLYRATTAASDVSYFSFTAGVGDVDKVIYFKIWDGGSNWYGYNSASGGKFSSDITDVTLNTSYGDARMCIIMPGTYKFTWNKSTKKLSVAYPDDVYYLRGGFNSWDWSHPMTEVRSGVYAATINLTEANHTYEANTSAGFKVLIAGKYYGKNGTTVTRANSTGSADISGCNTSGNNFGLTTDFTGNYTFEYTVASNTLKVIYPTAYKITFGKGTINGSASTCSAIDIDNGSASVTSNSTWVKSGNRVVLTAPAAKSGYTYDGWFDNNSGTGGAITTNANCTVSVTTSGMTRYACYHENMTTVNLVASPLGKGTFSRGGVAVTSVEASVASHPEVTAVPGTGYSVNTGATVWSKNNDYVTLSSTTSNPVIITGSGTAGNTTTLTATFTPNPYTITLNHQNGTSNTNISVTYDATTNLTSGVTPPEKTGYTFGGYYTGEGGTGTQLIEDDGDWITDNAYISSTGTWVNAGNVTLHAKWTEDMHTVTVTSDGHGSITTPTAPTTTVSAGIATGASIAASASPGYTFYNWTVTSGSATFTNANAASTTVKATSDATVQANFVDTWNIKGDQWSSWAYQPMTATANDNEYSKSYTLTKGTKYQFKVIKRVDYNGSNDVWYGNTDNAGNKVFERGESAFTTVANGMNNNLEVTPDVTGTYTFTIDVSGSTPVITVTYPEAYTITYGVGTHEGSDAAISVDPSFASGDYVLPETDVTFSKGSTKTGYTWKGWYSNVGGTGDAWSTTDASLSLTATRDADISVYACYNVVNYTITYNLNGGTNPVSPAPATGFTIESSAITLPTPTKTGYLWNGWYANEDLSTGDVQTTIASGSTGNKEYWAKWTPITYTIHFNGNGNTSGSMSDQTGVAYDSETTITANAFVKTGYSFAGWATTAERAAAGTVDRADGANHGNLTAVQGTTVDLFAIWTPKQSALTFDYQTSAEGYGASGSISAVSATYDATMPTLSGTMPPAAAGYAFMGFYDATGGGGTKYYNADGSSAHVWDKDKTTGTTLYAHWVKAEITELEHDATVAKGNEVYLDVNPVLNVTPTDYTAICWTLHYAANDNEVATSGETYYSVAAYTEGGTKPNQVRFTLNNMAVGSYYVKAVLKANASSGFDPCSIGTTIDTETSAFSIVGSSKITIQYQYLGTGDVIASSGLVEIEAGGNATVEAPNIIGYTFNSWSVGAGVTKNSEDGNTINISAPYDGVITAFYTKKNMIYFNNTVDWDHVYVYFYSDNNYWGNDVGTGAQSDKYINSSTPHEYHFWGEMTQIEGTNIWYFDYQAAAATIDPTHASAINSYTNVAFTKDAQGYTDASHKGYEWFHQTEVVRRSDFAHSKSMFVPLTEPNRMLNNGTTKYYDEGYWMNYPDNTGYTLKIYEDNTTGDLIKEIKFPFTADKKMPMSITSYLEGDQTYGFTIYRADGNTYGNDGTMSNGHSGDGEQGVWEFKTGKNRAGLTTTSAGNYTFTLNYGQDLESAYNYLVGVRYPESTGDFRVQYKDNVNSTWKTSAVIPAVTEADTVSYFVRHSSSPYIRVQKCTATWSGSATTVTWDNENSGSDILPDTISADGVYNFIFTKSGDNLVLSKVEPYTGNFYIRTDSAGATGWESYRAADHIMPFSEYSFNQTNNPYSHYFMQYYRTKTDEGDDLDPTDISFVVANDYSSNISDTITADAANYYVDGSGVLSGHNANIRFMYNYKTNEATRRYLDDAQGPRATDFLLLIPSNSTSIYDAQTGGSGKTQVQLDDKGNWVYETSVWVKPGTTYKVQAKYGANEHMYTQYLKGKASGDGEYETLIGGSGDSRLQIRLMYDFKTNRVIAAYLPSDGTIDGDITLDADIMFVREHQGNVTQISFGENKSISEIQNVYSVLRFNKSTIIDPSISRYERDLFYVSFPFNVRVSDIIGFGTYGTHWIIEYYDGAGRAEKGFWADSKSFWKFVTPAMKDTFTLKAGTGYIVALDLDEMEAGDPVWKNTSTVELIFPGDINSISNQTVTYTMPSHQCNINRGTIQGDRRIKDSHWNVLGVPTYYNTTGSFANHTDDLGGGESQVWSADGKPNYLYTWNMTDNSLTVTNASGYKYKAMHAYVVQYYGDVTFTASTNAVPASVAARRNENALRDVEFRLEIQQNETTVDQTFVRLSNDEHVTTGFEFNYDMSKEFNKNKANIYTIVSTMMDGDLSLTETAGNCLPMSEQTTVVPVGVKIAATGDYTFAIPEGTNGVGVTLIDNETGIRTPLSALDYTVSLTAGTYNERFVLEISPIHHMPTGIENSEVSHQHSDVRKVLIDGILYIVKDGKMFDAQGKRLQ